MFSAPGGQLKGSKEMDSSHEKISNSEQGRDYSLLHKLQRKSSLAKVEESLTPEELSCPTLRSRLLSLNYHVPYVGSYDKCINISFV
jgi:hypothetical protein